MDSSSIRNHNERLILSLIWKTGNIPSSKIAQLTSFSAQTSSVITRKLEDADLIIKGKPVKGNVGKPYLPISLNPDGAFAFGLLIGRRHAELVLVDFQGQIRVERSMYYTFPTPERVLQFVRDNITNIQNEISPSLHSRIIGIGIAVPFELWKWSDVVGVPREEMNSWRDFDLTREISVITSLPTISANDGTMACNGELVFGKGSVINSFGYFFVDTFIGGGLVLDGKLVLGQNNNAGAFGTIPVSLPNGSAIQLIQKSSIFVLERMLQEYADQQVFQDKYNKIWFEQESIVNKWIEDTAKGIAIASVAVSAIVDVPHIIIDGNFPGYIRSRLVDSINNWIHKVDTRGIVPPKAEEGTLGSRAGAIGAAFQPIASQFFIN
ncbi:MAG: ROK family transcriptional regulator [Rhodobacteraceae bacterium]|nr:ROK family transcriptional regulator [Paracoccaceae bacterium]